MINQDMIMIADMVAKEKNIGKEDVLLAIESAIQRAAQSRYGTEKDIRAFIDRKTGIITLFQYVEVVELIEFPERQMGLREATKYGLVAGDYWKEELPALDYGRIAANAAKQVIIQKMREAERVQQYEDYKDRVGEIINGTVKRIEYGNITIDLGKSEAILKRDEIIPREHFNFGDRVRAYIYDVKRELRGPQIYLSRTHPGFMQALFKQEVPEIYEGVLKIISVSRDPGSRAKIAVYSSDSTIDPIGSCVGMKGSRVQAVVNELQGEKVDIILWSNEPATFIVNAMAPAAVSKVVIKEGTKKIEVVVPEDQLSLAIGRRGQNVRLASILTGFDIDILTEDQEATKRANENNLILDEFKLSLDVDEIIARLLMTEGFQKVEQLLLVPHSELAKIEGFDEDIATELQLRAQNYLNKKQQTIVDNIANLGINHELQGFEGLNSEMLQALGEHQVRTLDDFADLATDDLIDAKEGIFKQFALSKETAEEMIMRARSQLGWI